MKGYKHLTAEQKARVLNLFQELGHTQLVQKETGHSGDQIRHTLLAAGLKPSGGRVGACHSNRTLIEQMARNGDSLTSIATAVGTNRKTVRKFLQRMPIERTPYVQVGPNNPAWNGGRMKDKHGYILVLLPDHPHANRHGYVREHRVVMEQVLGRLLLRTEVVHHLSGEKSDNRPENLVVYASNAKHLQDELTGKMPNWTAEGRSKLKALCSNRDARGRLLPIPKA